MLKIFDIISMKKLFPYLLAPFVDVNNKCSTKGRNMSVLDGVRGLAVLIVIASHTKAFCMKGQGSLGVFLFFFLSGIVLTIPYANSPREIFNIKELFIYFLNRMCRIMPLYVVMVAVYTLFLQENFEWYLWNVSFLKGWNHLWSVAEEVRFYILFPAVIGVLALFDNRYIRLVLLVIFILLSFEYADHHRIDMLVGRKVDFYFYMFLGGGLTYFLTLLAFVDKYLKKTIIEKLFNVLVLTIFMLFFFSSIEMVEIFWRPLFPKLPTNFVANGWRMPGVWLFLFMVFFFALITYTRSIVYRVLSSFFFRHIGLLSYSLYLSHMFTLNYLRSIGFKDEGLFFATLFISYLIALLSYVFIEKPFLMLKKDIAKYLRKTTDLQNNDKLPKPVTPIKTR